MNIRKEENNGVTLIALVVTILTLLILSLVAVLTLSGESGILAQIERAGIETELDNISEKINIMAMQNNVDIIFDKAEADTITYLQKEGVLDTNNKVNTELLLGRITKYGNGIENDIFKLENGKIVYINSDGAKVASKNVDVFDTTEYHLKQGKVSYSRLKG